MQGRRVWWGFPFFSLVVLLVDGTVGAVYVDAPNVLVPADVRVFTGETSASEAVEEESTSTARGWWRTNPERTSAVGLEASLGVLRDVLSGTRFDVRLLYFVSFAHGSLSVFCTGCVWIQVSGWR